MPGESLYSQEDETAHRPDPGAEADRFETSLRREHPVIWWATLVGPLSLPVLGLAVILVVAGRDLAERLLLTAVATFFFLGRFVILGGQEPSADYFFSPEELFALVLFMDLMTALVLAFHTGFISRLPWVGAHLRDLAGHGRAIVQAHPWIRRTTFIGVVALVIFPVAATGSVGGSVLGHLLGMSRRATFLAVALGSFLGSGIMYCGAALINRYVDRNRPFVTVLAVVVLALLAWLLRLRYRRLRQRS